MLRYHKHMHTQNFQILIKPIWVFLIFWDLLHSNGGTNYKILKMKMKNRRTFNFSAIFLLLPSSFFLLLLFLFCLPAFASSFLVLFANFYLFNFSLIFPFLFDLSAAALHMFCYLALKFSSFNYSFYFFCTLATCLLVFLLLALLSGV
jgi:hypothetical protein